MNELGRQPLVFSDPHALADAVITRVGSRIVLGLPLGVGKANEFTNALFERACADRRISLTIFTALTLEAPPAGNELARRFLDPLRDRFFGDYPRLAYARALQEGTLPANIRVQEFFLQPGKWLGNPQVQQNYVSLNYTYALQFLLNARVSVIAQLLAPPEEYTFGERPEQLSLSSNPDISADLLDLRQAGKLECLFVGELNRHLPFMYGAALRRAEEFDLLLDTGPVNFPLFKPPQQPASLTDHAIGLHVARLIPDGGTLQIGIGSIGDAIAAALILRQQDNDSFREGIRRLLGNRKTLPGYEEPFHEGLYGLSEMLVEGFLALINADIIKREVDGYLMHAGFFMGSPNFYRMLAQMGETRRHRIAMMPVSFTNELYGDLHSEEQQKRRARTKARFVNSAIMVTLTGAVVSDGLESGQVISGVGGQHNFVTQAHALADARSIITLRATRTHKGRVHSNLCWNYAHTTIPRHMRDIVVTEYGAADLRGKSDAEVIAALLNIADSRFQPALLRQAKRAKKIPADYEIAPLYRQNTPEFLQKTLEPLHARGYLDPFPLGSDFTVTEQQLAAALKILSERNGSPIALWPLLKKSWRSEPDDTLTACLRRMDLEAPSSLTLKLYRRLLIGALQETLSSAT